MTESTHKNLIRISIALILIIIAVAIAFEVRTGPQDMSGLDEQVERSLYQNIRNQIANDVRQQNPGLPDTFIDDRTNPASTIRSAKPPKRRPRINERTSPTRTPDACT